MVEVAFCVRAVVSVAVKVTFCSSILTDVVFVGVTREEVTDVALELVVAFVIGSSTTVMFLLPAPKRTVSFFSEDGVVAVVGNNGASFDSLASLVGVARIDTVAIALPGLGNAGANNRVVLVIVAFPEADPLVLTTIFELKFLVAVSVEFLRGNASGTEFVVTVSLSFDGINTAVDSGLADSVNAVAVCVGEL
jgi:hypothetical protein